MVDWNQWRRDYPTSTYRDQRRFYDSLGHEQTRDFHTKKLSHFIREFLYHNPIKNILELGGGNGNLYCNSYPHVNYFWHNIEITPIKQNPLLNDCSESNYKFEVLDDYLWNKPPLEGYDLFVASHVLEHISKRDLTKLVQRLQTKYVIAETPLSDQPQDWTDYEGSHIFEGGMLDLIEIFEANGYKLKHREGWITVFEKTNLVHFATPQRIFMAGWFFPTKGCGEMSKYIESCGHSVYKFSIDEQDPDQLDPIDYHVLTQTEEPLRTEYQRKYKRLPMVEYIDQSQFDFIIIYQGNMIFDLAGITIPQYYIHRDLVYPHFPINAHFRAVFFCYHGAREQLYWLYTPEIYKTHMEFLTYATCPNFVKPNPNTERDIFLAFKGSLAFKNGPLNDHIMKHIYDLRVRYVKYAEDYHGLHLEGRSESRKERDEWIDLMSRVSIGLNVPGIYGWDNERMFDTLAMKCVLLQWHYPGIEALGFQNRVNCLLFDSERGMSKQINWARSHPKELEQIRAKGYQLALKNTYSARADRMLEVIAMLTNHDQYYAPLRQKQANLENYKKIWRVWFAKNFDSDRGVWIGDDPEPQFDYGKGEMIE